MIKLMQTIQNMIDAIRSRKLDPPIPYEKYSQFLYDLQLTLQDSASEDRVVNVITTTANDTTTYSLDEKAGVLFSAGDVTRKHVTDGGTYTSKLVRKTLTDDGYEFAFDTGDVFSASTDDAYPTASSISDSTGGGSGGLPTPTAEDVGKVLTVVEKYTTSGTVVPQQTVENTVEGVTLTGTDASAFVDGASILLTLSNAALNVAEVLLVRNNKGELQLIYSYAGVSYFVYKIGNDLKYRIYAQSGVEVPVSSTIKLETVSESYEWAAASAT